MSPLLQPELLPANICKSLHSVFFISIEKGTTMTYQHITGLRLEQERQKWNYINWLIIDETSMIYYGNL